MSIEPVRTDLTIAALKREAAQLAKDYLRGCPEAMSLVARYCPGPPLLELKRTKALTLIARKYGERDWASLLREREREELVARRDTLLAAAQAIALANPPSGLAERIDNVEYLYGALLDALRLDALRREVCVLLFVTQQSGCFNPARALARVTIQQRKRRSLTLSVASSLTSSFGARVRSATWRGRSAWFL